MPEAVKHKTKLLRWLTPCFNYFFYLSMRDGNSHSARIFPISTKVRSKWPEQTLDQNSLFGQVRLDSNFIPFRSQKSKLYSEKCFSYYKLLTKVFIQGVYQFFSGKSNLTESEKVKIELPQWKFSDIHNLGDTPALWSDEKCIWLLWKYVDNTDN